jgi:hypothetical protein
VLSVGHDEVSEMPKKTTPKKTTKIADEQFRLARSAAFYRERAPRGLSKLVVQFLRALNLRACAGKGKRKIQIASINRTDEVQERKIEGVEDFERKELAPQT